MYNRNGKLVKMIVMKNTEVHTLGVHYRARIYRRGHVRTREYVIVTANVDGQKSANSNGNKLLQFSMYNIIEYSNVAIE